MIYAKFRRLLALPVKKLRRHRAKKDVRKLMTHQSSLLSALGAALDASLSNLQSDEERVLIASIEERRSDLLRSGRKISVVDFGAGSSASNRTKDEMESGVSSTRLVADICMASKAPFWAALLFNVIRKVEPTSCIELGTCLGISAAYQSTALAMNKKGALVTLEGSSEIARIAKGILDGLELSNVSVITGPFHETLDGALDSMKPIDFFFNDGHHDHDAVIRYFNASIPYLAENAVIIIDDISWSPGMRRAWSEIENNGRVSASIDLHSMGIAVICRDCAVKEKLRIPL